MIGHGGPTTSPTKRTSAAVKPAGRRCWFALVLLGVLAPRGPLMADEVICLRIAWGGGTERQWSGTVSLSTAGSLSKPRPLGIEADEPGSMWIEDEQLLIRQRSPRAFDGVDLWVDAPRGARLQIGLVAADAPDQPRRIQVPLADLLSESSDVGKQLDEEGNRLLVRRVPGDSLRVSFQRQSLIFAPGERFQFIVEPYLPHLPPDAKAIQVQLRLVSAGSGEEQEVSSHMVPSVGAPGRFVSIEPNVALPTREGVYDLMISAEYRAPLLQAVRKPLTSLNRDKTVARRKIQLLVLDRQSPLPLQEDEPQLRWPIVDEIDPANPGLRERLVSKIPGLRMVPLSSGNMRPWKHPLGDLVRLDPSSQASDVSWETYPLSIAQPGRPHVLEVEYPNDVPQTLGISILEPDAAGELKPIGLDSGVDRSEEIVADSSPPKLVRHRLIFWPRTQTPMVLMTNRRDRSPAVYGKIRVRSAGEHLPRAGLSSPPSPTSRLLAAYFDRPLFPENFSARQSLDIRSRRSLDDWGTFYEGGTRLVEYLQHVGYGGLIISVVADGSTIYPSSVLQPTPRYDTGVYFASGQDPVRKDVLEMLLRLFDREGLQLIPAIEFAAPLPSLETLRRQGGPGSESLQWIGREGRTWCQDYPVRRGLAPYYNVLDPRVQDAMLDVVREVTGRYAHHESFGGLAILLSAQGYAQLPGPDWGWDDITVGRFEQDTNVRISGTGPDRFARRAHALLNTHNARWLQWRAGELGRFYRGIQAGLTQVKPGSRLYLTGAEMFSGPDREADLRPALTLQTRMSKALLRVGIDAKHLRNTEGPILLRPERITPTGDLGARAVDLEIRQMSDVDDYFRDLGVAGSLFFHPRQEARVASFDRKSPFKSSYTWLVAQPVPSDLQNRRRFVHSLATIDAQVMVDGGWMLPMGQGDSIRDLVAVYSHLPAVPFRQAGDTSEIIASQPVTFRYATHLGKTYLYAVNDAPFATTAWIRVRAQPDCRLEELTGSRPVEPLERGDRGTYWEVHLKPYDLVAVRLSQPNVEFLQPGTSSPQAVHQALKRRIGDLGSRARALNPEPNPPRPMSVLDNPGFDSPATAEDPVPGWQAPPLPEGATIQLDAAQKHSGSQSVRMRISSKGNLVSLVSQPFEPPATGRLQIEVSLRVADAARQPSLWLAVGGKYDGRNYYRFGEVGNLSDSDEDRPISTEWRRYVLAFNDLPLRGLTQLHVRFDLLGPGPGEVWIDDVRLFDLDFSDERERYALTTLIAEAGYTLEQGQLGDCMRLLEGYWPQFLEAHVPLTGTVPRRPGPVRPLAKRPEPNPQPAGMLDRVKGLLPKPLRF